MLIRGKIDVPLAVLSRAIFVPYGSPEGATRPSGKNLIGTDLQLFYLLLAAAENAVDDVVMVSQVTLTHCLGRFDIDRIHASLKRLQGTDMLIGPRSIPCVIAWQHEGTGNEPRQWSVQLDRRSVDLVRASIRAGNRATLHADHLKALRSKLSLALCSRFVAWVHGELPSNRAISIGRRPSKKAFQVDIPFDRLGLIFGTDREFRPSEVGRLLVTGSDKCPLKRELGAARVEVDTFVARSEATDRAVGLHMMISAITIEGLAHLRAEERHQENDYAARRAAYRSKASI